MPELVTALTPRELMVAELIAEGLTNEEIAERLLISRRTVHVHLYNSYTKLGLKNRTQLGRWITDRHRALAAESYPASRDVVLVQGMIMAWMERLPLEDRPAEVLRLIQHLMTSPEPTPPSSS